MDQSDPWQNSDPWQVVPRQVFTAYDCFNINFSSVCCSLLCWLSLGYQCDPGVER